MAKAKMTSIITIPTTNKIYGLDAAGNLWLFEPDGKPAKWVFVQVDPDLPASALTVTPITREDPIG